MSSRSLNLMPRSHSTVRDVMGRKRAGRRITVQDEQSAPDDGEAVLLLTRPDFRLLYANRAAQRLWELGTDGPGRSAADLWNRSNRQLIRTLQWFVTSGADETRFTYRCRTPRGTTVLLAIRIRLLETTEPACLVIEAGELQPDSRLPALQPRDELTGLPTRSVFEDRLRQALGRAMAGGPSFAVLFVDLDRFKETNDRYGHLAGDCVLQTVARRLSIALRPADLVTRFGGDEFLLLVEGIGTRAAAARLARRLRRELSQPVVFGEECLAVAASIGAAVCPLDGLDRERLLDYADRAMYRAKRESGPVRNVLQRNT